MNYHLSAYPEQLRKLFIFFIYFFASWVILLVFISFPRLNGHPPSMFGDMIYGTADQPFVGRVLVPSAVRLITSITPDSFIEKVENAASYKRPLKRLVDVSQIEDEYVFEYLAALAVIYCCFFGFAFAVRALIKEYYTYPRFVEDLAPLGALLITPALFRYDNYLYDPATIILFALWLLTVSRKRWPAYYTIFILACINKETAPLLGAIFLVYQWKKMKPLPLAGHLLIQGALWIVSRYMIWSQFRDNPGGAFEFHLLDHNLVLFEYAFRSVYFIVVIGLYIILIGYKWNQKPLLLRRGFLITFIPLAVAGMFVGFIDEVRIYYEAYPFAFLLALPTVVEVFGERSQTGTPIEMKPRIGDTVEKRN